MLYITSILIGSISGFIPLLPVMAVFHFGTLRKDRKDGVTTAAPHIAAVYIFCFALLSIFSVTGIPDLYHLRIDANINLSPFAYISDDRLQYILNVLLFVPIGFLLPMLWKRFHKIYLTFLCGFLLSLFIEMIQLFSFRATDVDDVMMNTAGTLIGYVLFMLIKIIFPKISLFAADGTSHWKPEPYLCFLFAWLSMFLVQPFISEWMWRVFILRQ